MIVARLVSLSMGGFKMDEQYLKSIQQQLHQAGFKLTPQREATVCSLIENEEGHLSAEEVYMRVKEKSPDIGLATVYRTLEILSELKILDKVSFTEFLLGDQFSNGKVPSKEMFDRIDKNSDGYITQEEFDKMKATRKNRKGKIRNKF